MTGGVRALRWEAFVAVMVVLAAAWATTLSPYYLDAEQLLFSSRNFVFTGIMALGLMVVILTGEMDLSLGSILAVCTVLLAKASAAGTPLPLALLGIFGVAGALGAVNGLLVARLRLPALAVTLGTMGAYRGLAFIIGSEVGYTGFDGTYRWLGSATVGGLAIPVMLFLFAAMLVTFVVVVHFTTFGRRCQAIGSNASAVAYSGIDVVRNKVVAYVVAALTAALGAWIFVGQFGSARGDNANGVILAIITSVVLGGVDINGGRGTVVGVFLATLFLWTLRNGMGLANIAGPIQQLIIGVLLLTSVLVSNFTRHAGSARRSWGGRRGGTGGVVAAEVQQAGRGPSPEQMERQEVKP
jgi:rhamnose transport system permease protein